MLTLEDWVFDFNADTWFQGTAQNGSGVFQQSDTKWYGNLIHPHLIDIQAFGPYETKEDCIQAIIQEFERIEQLNQITGESNV